MRAVVCRSYGPPEDLIVDDALGVADGPTEAHKVNLARMLLKGYAAEDGDWPSEMFDLRREAARAKYDAPIAH